MRSIYFRCNETQVHKSSEERKKSIKNIFILTTIKLTPSSLGKSFAQYYQIYIFASLGKSFAQYYQIYIFA
jgi:hypothetical protein